jgi:hypothetical protein
MRVEIDGLTEVQAKFLDIMWTLDTKEKFFAFFETLTPEEMTTVLTLQDIVIQEVTFKTHGDDLEVAKNMLRNIGVET